MLPDFPAIKSTLLDTLLTAANQLQESIAGLAALVSVFPLFEGDKTLLVRRDGSSEEHPIGVFKERLQLDSSDLQKQSLLKTFIVFCEIAARFARNKSMMTFDQVRKAVEKTGNMIDAGGKPFSPEFFIEVMEKYQLDFDEDENPLTPTLFVSYRTVPRVAEVMRALEQEEPYASTMKAIIARKLEEWRVREGNRKLVD